MSIERRHKEIMMKRLAAYDIIQENCDFNLYQEMLKQGYKFSFQISGLDDWYENEKSMCKESEQQKISLKNVFGQLKETFHINNDDILKNHMLQIPVFDIEKTECPPSMKESFKKTYSDFKGLQNKLWEIFEADILFSVSYHMTWKNTEFSYEMDGNLFQNKPQLLSKSVYEEFKNIPLFPEIEVNDKKELFHVNSSICNGLMNEINKDTSNNPSEIRYLFKKDKPMFNVKDGQYLGATLPNEKGGSLKNYICHMDEILDLYIKKSEDIWFFNGFFDPAFLLYSVEELTKGEERCISNDIYHLIWGISRCKSPTGRLCLMKNILPLYRYVTEQSHATQENKDYFFHLLETIVQSMNNKFIMMASISYDFIKEMGITGLKFEEYMESYKQAFFQGLSFGYVIADERKQAYLDGEARFPKKMEIILGEGVVSQKAQRIYLAVICALQENREIVKIKTLPKENDFLNDTSDPWDLSGAVFINTDHKG